MIKIMIKFYLYLLNYLFLFISEMKRNTNLLLLDTRIKRRLITSGILVGHARLFFGCTYQLICQEMFLTPPVTSTGVNRIIFKRGITSSQTVTSGRK